MTQAAHAAKPHFDLTQTAFWRVLLSVTRAVMVVSAVGATLAILATAFMRYVMNTNFFGSEDIILLFAFWLYFMGAVHGSYENSHIKADLLNVYIHNLSIKDAIALLAQAISAAVTLILMTWGFNQVIWLIDKMPRTTALKMPILATQSVLFIGFALMLFYQVVYLVKNVRAYLIRGHFSEPLEGDYISAAIREKCPTSTAPLKSELTLDPPPPQNLAGDDATDGSEQ